MESLNARSWGLRPCPVLPCSRRTRQPVSAPGHSSLGRRAERHPRGRQCSITIVVTATRLAVTSGHWQRSLCPATGYEFGSPSLGPRRFRQWGCQERRQWAVSSLHLGPDYSSLRPFPLLFGCLMPVSVPRMVQNLNSWKKLYYLPSRSFSSFGFFHQRAESAQRSCHCSDHGPRRDLCWPSGCSILRRADSHCQR